MSSVPSPVVHNDENESTKPKRLPRSAKKRLRYEPVELAQEYRTFTLQSP